MTKLYYSEEITTVFGDFIHDNNIVCSVKEFKSGFKRLKKIMEERPFISEKKPRKQSGFFKWLNSDGNRNSIKDEYFNDFDSWDDWSESGIVAYYKNKNLSTDKLNILIEKKKNCGKEIKKPRIMSLINLKAGILWSEMNDEEKDKWNDSTNIVNIPSKETSKSPLSLDSDDLDVNISATSSPSKGKKGRPSGYKPKNYTSECFVKKAIDSVETGNNEEIDLEEFSINGVEYLKDEKGIVYNMECVEIGTLDKNSEIVFN